MVKAVANSAHQNQVGIAALHGDLNGRQRVRIVLMRGHHDQFLGVLRHR